MKFFTNELWSKFNSESQRERDEAELEWAMNIKEYETIFEALKVRLSKKFLKIYLKNHGFHDFRVEKIEVLHKERGVKNPISVNINVTDGLDNYKILYKCVRKFKVTYEDTDGWEETRGFDDWGYTEFIPIDELTISHEILFASGATVLIHFKNNNVFIDKTN